MNKATYLIFLLAIMCLTNAYSDLSLSITVKVKPDATAHVTEKVLISLNSKEEIEAFDYKMRTGENTLVDWTKFSPSGYIRYHIRGDTVPANLRIYAKRDFNIGETIGVIIMEYDITVPIMNITKKGSRIYEYKLRNEFLSLEKSAFVKETILPKGTTLTFILPEDARIISVAPEPSLQKENTISWEGQITGVWLIHYEREKPLSMEVSEFFNEFFQTITYFIPVIIAAAVLSIILLKLAKNKKKQ